MLTPRPRRGLRQAMAVVAVAVASAAVVAGVVHGSASPAGPGVRAPIAMTPTASSPEPTPLTAEQSTHRWQVYDDTADEITSLLTPLGTFGGLWFDDSLGLDTPVLHLASTAPLPASVTTQITTLLDGEPVVYQHSPVTEAYLVAVQDEITSSGLWDSLHISQSSTDVVTSTVQITIPTASAPGTEHLLRSRLGPHLRITRSDEMATAVAGVGASG